MELDDELIALGQRLKRARQRIGITAEELASRTGIPLGSIANYESGRHEMKALTLRSIAETLATSPDHLLGNIGENHDHSFLRRGWILVDMGMVRQILAADSVADLEDVVCWTPTMIRWNTEVPQDFVVLSPDQYAEMRVDVTDALARFRDELSPIWVKRAKKAGFI